MNLMTMVLLLTNKDDITIDYVVSELINQKIPFYRFNTEELCHTVFVSLDYTQDVYMLKDVVLDEVYDFMEFTSVYYRRPKLPEYNESNLSDGERNFLQSEAYYTLEGIYKLLDNKFWISHVYAIREAENKPYQISLAKKLGFNIPPSILTNNKEDFDAFLNTYNKDCIIKSVHNCRILDKDNSRIVYTSKLQNTFEQTLIQHSVNYLQQRINKKYDVRVTVVGEDLFAVAIESQVKDDTKTDWRKGQHILEHRRIELPKSIAKKCINMLSYLGLNYAAIDFVVDQEDNYIFLEINPNGQWAWIENLTGCPITRSIVNTLCHEKETL